MNKIVLWYFTCVYFHEILNCRIRIPSVDAARFFDDDNKKRSDDNPRELNAMIKHCGEEEHRYKNLIIMSVSDVELNVEFYRNVHEEFSIPVQVFDDTNGLDFADWRSCVILCLSNRQFDRFSKSVDRYSWMANNMYVIYIFDAKFEIKEKEKEMEKVWSLSASKLWEEKYVHKFVLSINGRNLFFDPFEPSGKSEIIKDLNSNETNLPWNTFGVVKELGDSFELLKIRDTFEGYEVNVTLFPYITVEKNNNGYTWSGPDADTMYEICKRMKVIPRVFDTPDKFGWFAKGKFFGSLGRLVYHDSDLAFNGFFVKYYGTGMLEFSSYLGADKICVIVPKRARMPEYLLIVRIFSMHSWLLICIGNSFVALTYAGTINVTFGTLGVKKFEKSVENATPPNPGASGKLTRVQHFLGNWIFLCFYPVKINAERLGHRLQVGFGLMLGIVIGGCFTSQLASSFSRPAFLKNIETLAELDDSGLEILTSFPNLLNDVFADNETSTYRNLQAKLKLKSTSEIETQVLQKRNAGYIDRLHSLKLAKNPNEGLHVLSEYPQEYPLAYPIMKGSPFLPRMNTIIGRLQNGGLYKKWYSDMMKPLKNDESKNPVVIRLPHLYIPFFLLFIGLGIAGGIFCSELYHLENNSTLSYFRRQI